MLLATQLNSTASKLERWLDHFTYVSNISTQLVDSVVVSVPETVPEPPPAPAGDESLSCVHSVDEVRAALQALKNGKAPGGDEITAELLKLGLWFSGWHSWLLLCGSLRQCQRIG